MCRSSSVSALPHSPHWVCLRQATLYSLSCAGSCDETLISFVGLSPDSAVKRMSSKFVFCPPPERTLTRAGCSSVRQKLGCSYPTQGGEIRVDSFLLVVPWDPRWPEESFQTCLSFSTRDFCSVRRLSERSESCDVLYCSQREPARRQAEGVGTVFGYSCTSTGCPV